MEFRAVVGRSADAILLVTSDGRVTYMNAAAEALFGRTLAEMADRRHTDLVAERYRRHNLLETSGQLEVLRAGGPPFTAEWTAFPVDPERGLYAVQVRDLTERWLAEQAIRRSETNFRALIESHPDMVGVIDG